MGTTESSNLDISNESQEYFDLIQKKIIKETQIQNIDRANPTQTKSTKNWKEVILKFLNKQYNIGIQWAKDLHALIQKNPFNSEGNFLDLFFWQIFEMRTKPRCLNQTLSQSTMTLNQSQSQMDASLSEYQLNKEKILEYVKIFQKHLKCPDHPIAICIQLFMGIFCKEIQFHINEILEFVDQKEKVERAQIVAEAITQQLVFFMFKLQKCFGLMYSKVLAFKYFEQEKEEFTTMFTTEFFLNKQLYSLIMQLFTLCNENEIISFESHIKTLNSYNIQPADLGIDPKFRLDRFTEKTQLEFLVKHNVCLSDEKLIYLNTYHKKPGYVSYQTSIDLLNNIKAFQTPNEKITLLHSMGAEVIDNVMKAWKPMEEFLPKNYLSIDGDELILIFSYIIIKAQMPELLTHLYFIKMFTTQDTKSSMIGYYYTTIEASVITVKGINEKDIEEKHTKKKKNIRKEENGITEEEQNGGEVNMIKKDSNMILDPLLIEGDNMEDNKNNVEEIKENIEKIKKSNEEINGKNEEEKNVVEECNGKETEDNNN